MFVSRRILPGIRIDLFAAVFNGAGHGLEVGWINATSESQEIFARCSGGFGQAAREIQDLALVSSVQAVHLFDNFVFDGLGHDEINLGKGIFNVKCASHAEGATGRSAEWVGLAAIIKIYSGIVTDCKYDF
jgi:hypothetical protein